MDCCKRRNVLYPADIEGKPHNPSLHGDCQYWHDHCPASYLYSTVDLLPSTVYTWKVKANGANVGDYSVPFTFTTSPNPPKPPVLTSPANAALVDGAAVQTLKWDPVLAVVSSNDLTNYPTAASFEVEYATNIAFTDSTGKVVNGNTLAETQLSLSADTLLPNRIHYWRVRSWSEADAGEITASGLLRALSARTVDIPANSAHADLTDKCSFTCFGKQTSNLHLDRSFWRCLLHLQILKGSAVVITGTITVPLHTYTPAKDLLAGTTYTWKVKANGLISSGYSDSFTFTTASNSPKVPVLTLPANNALVDSAAVQILKWNPVLAVTTTSPATSYPLRRVSKLSMRPTALSLVPSSRLSPATHSFPCLLERSLPIAPTTGVFVRGQM